MLESKGVAQLVQAALVRHSSSAPSLEAAAPALAMLPVVSRAIMEDDLVLMRSLSRAVEKALDAEVLMRELATVPALAAALPNR